MNMMKVGTYTCIAKSGLPFQGLHGTIAHGQLKGKDPFYMPGPFLGTCGEHDAWEKINLLGHYQEKCSHVTFFIVGLLEH